MFYFLKLTSHTACKAGTQKSNVLHDYCHILFPLFILEEGVENDRWMKFERTRLEGLGEFSFFLSLSLSGIFSHCLFSYSILILNLPFLRLLFFYIHVYYLLCF